MTAKIGGALGRNTNFRCVFAFPLLVGPLVGLLVGWSVGWFVGNDLVKIGEKYIFTDSK